MAGSSQVMRGLFEEIGRASATSMTVLIRGETGTGKELVARAIHSGGSRAARPFVAINCTAIPEPLLESELLGHERGAYTGATDRRIGRFEEANLGTIFLDEIGDLNPSAQVKLLRVLEEKHIQRVGGNRQIPVDARVVAATHRDLEKAIKEGQFREDLFYRLKVLKIEVPPLRERLEDVPELVSCFAQRSAGERGVICPSVSADAMDFLCRKTWPGNVRELENVIRSAHVLAADGAISLAEVRRACGSDRRAAPADESALTQYVTALLAQAQQGGITDVRARAAEHLDRELFRLAINQARGNKTQAARWLGVTRNTLREGLLHFGLRPAENQPNDFEV
jgi:DNA-binding NtrC family response regulator